MDFNQSDPLEEFIHYTSPDIVINAAAFTPVDTAERNPDFAMQINGRSVETPELSEKMRFSDPFFH